MDPFSPGTRRRRHEFDGWEQVTDRQIATVLEAKSGGASGTRGRRPV